MRTPADNQRSITRYRRHAVGYDASARHTMALRLRTIALLELKPGDVVVDVGAGTGLSYPPLLDAVGPNGFVLAFEQSPEMFEQARRRADAAGWPNLWHVCADAETVRLPRPADALLFNYTHDISRSDKAVENLLAQAHPGARIAMAGMKYFPWWTGPLNMVAWLKNRPYNSRAADLWSPWDKVAARCRTFSRVSTQWGMGYVASGRLPGGEA